MFYRVVTKLLNNKLVTVSGKEAKLFVKVVIHIKSGNDFLSQ